MVRESTAPGSGGLIIPPEMQRILDQPGYLSTAKGGLRLRRMYSDQAETFNPTLLSSFALSCFTGDIEAVKSAVESGTAPDLFGTEGAFKFGYTSIVVNGKRGLRMGPFMKHAETLSYLLSRGCPPDTADVTGLTALCHATAHKALEADSSPIGLARMLLKSGADVNQRDRYGQVPILNAIMTGNIPSIDLLMEFGADLDIGDADNVIPREFFVQGGPEVAATVTKWLQKRSGEATLLAEKECGNCKSSGSGVSLKLCSKCRSIKYCSTSCQRSHWPTHKKGCHPFSAANTVSLKPVYDGPAGATVTQLFPMAPMMRDAMGIPNEPIPERNKGGLQSPNFSQSKSMVIKVQVPMMGPKIGDLLVYNKRRDFVCRVQRADKPAEYDRIFQLVRNQGVGGGKAYLSAELVHKDELVVKVSEVLAAQPW